MNVSTLGIKTVLAAAIVIGASTGIAEAHVLATANISAVPALQLRSAQ
jgi:hypothetical protein